LIFPVKKLVFYTFLLLAFCRGAYATHIVGGEIIYDFLGNDQYRITLKVYRDCINGQAPFDGNAIITVWTGTGDSVATHLIGSPIITNIPPTINNPCVQAPTNVCVEEGLYTYTLTLPPRTGGYYVVYQRCCRNNTILNLTAPGDQGSSYYTKIPGPEDAVVNSSPRFNNFPPIFVCNNVPFTFDHAATDPDGDQLVYSLCNAYAGLDACCPAINGPVSNVPGCISPPPSCPPFAPQPPYPSVNYASGYNGGYPISANPAFTINAFTGFLSGRPNLVGQYVVCVCIQEIRGNKVLNTHFRDFQFNVTPCVVNVLSLMQEPVGCIGPTVNFVNQSIGNVQLSYHWDFGVPVIQSDTSNLTNPTFVFPDTGVYVVTLIANPGKICSDTNRQTFYIYPGLQASFPHHDPQCLRFNAFNFSNSSTHVPQATFKWTFNSGTPPSSASKIPPTVTYDQPGKYFVKLWAKQFQCKDSLIDSIRIFDKPKAKINDSPVAACPPATVGFVNMSSSELPYVSNWKFSDGQTASGFEPVVIFPYVGVYSATLVITTTSICADTSIAVVKNVTVNPLPSSQFTLTPDTTTILDPEIKFLSMSSDDVSAWYYEFGDGGNSAYASPVHEYQMPGDYRVTLFVRNSFGCTDTSSRMVKIDPEYRFWIPNTFTPNGDGMNDLFHPVGIGWLEYEFEVYNKWGEKLFSTSETKRGWDGTFKGMPCEQDVYVYRITLVNEVTREGNTFIGHVNLLPGEK
jgi:gliding motility-associated-like protein